MNYVNKNREIYLFAGFNESSFIKYCEDKRISYPMKLGEKIIIFNPNNNERKNMKTSIKLLLGLGAIITLTFTAAAVDQLKVGQVQTGQTPAQVQASTAAAPQLKAPWP